MQVLLNIDAEQIIDIVSKMTIDEKLRLYDKIKGEILLVRLESLRKELGDTVKISDQEISREVEHVRTERYKNRH